MTAEWKSTTALEDWEEENEDWDPTQDTTPTEDWLLARLWENLSDLTDKSPTDVEPLMQRTHESMGELRLREFKVAFNEMAAETLDPQMDLDDARRLAALQLADQVFPRGMRDPAHDPFGDVTRAHDALNRYLADDGNRLNAHSVTEAVNAAPELQEAALDFRREDPAVRSPLETHALDNLAAALQEKGIDLPALDFRLRAPGQTPAEFQLQEMQKALHTAVEPADPAAADNPEYKSPLDQAAADLAQAVINPEAVSKWQDPEGYVRHAQLELYRYLRDDPEFSNPEQTVYALAEAGRRGPAAFGLEAAAAGGAASLEHLMESPAVEYREPAPEVAVKLAEFTEKLLEFYNDPNAVYERRRIHGYVMDSFSPEQPETLILKSLDIANNQMTFSSLEERRKFAEHAADALIDQILGGDRETRRLLAGAPYQVEPGYHDSFTKEVHQAYAAAENDFRELLTDQLATYHPAWTQHIPEEQVPERFAYIIKALTEILEGNYETDPVQAAERIAYQREHFSRHVEARAYTENGVTLPHTQHEQVPDFTLERYTEPPHYLRGKSEQELAVWGDAYGRSHWGPEDHALISDTLTALLERYPGSALHKDELVNHFPKHCLDDLKKMFHNQAFASEEHRRQEAAVIADQVCPADDPLLREWNQQGWQASAAANRLLQDYLNRDYGDNVTYYRMTEQNALARQARQEAREFLRELEAVAD